MTLSKHSSKGAEAPVEVLSPEEGDTPVAKAAGTVAAASPRPAATAARPPRVAPAPPPSVRAEEPGAEPDELDGFGPKAEAPAPAAPKAEQPRPAAASNDMAELVRNERPNLGAAPAGARPSPLVPPAPRDEPAPSAEASLPEPSADAAGLDPAAVEALSSLGEGLGEGKSAEEPEDPEDAIYAAGATDAVERMLLASGSPDPEIRAIAKEYINLLGNTFAPRKKALEAEAPEAALDAARRKALEAARQASGGGGLGSMLGSLLGMGRNSAGSRAEAYERDKEAYARDYNRTTEGFRDRLYNHRMAQFMNGLLNVQGEADTLNMSIVQYNKAFIQAPAAKPLSDAVDAWMAREGIDLDEAASRLSKDAPPEVASAIAEVRDAALADSDVAAARKRMYEQEDRFAESARKAAADSDLLARNFHDKEFDPENARDNFVKGINEIADQLADPVAEEESRQKMKERMRELAEGLRKAFDMVIDKVVSMLARSSTPKF